MEDRVKKSITSRTAERENRNGNWDNNVWKFSKTDEKYVFRFRKLNEFKQDK